MIAFRRKGGQWKQWPGYLQTNTVDDYTNTVDDYANTVDDNDNKEEGNNDDNGQVTCEQCQLLQFGDEDDGD